METYKYINIYKSWAQNAISEVMQPWCEKLQKALLLAVWAKKQKNKKKVFTDRPTGQFVYAEQRKHLVVSEGFLSGILF